MDNNTPAAATPAPAPATDATPNTNSNPAPVAPAEPQTPAITLEQAAQFIGMKPEILEERMKVEKANGGPEKCFENFKKYTADPSSRPSAQQPAEPQAPVQPVAPQVSEPAPLQPQQPVKPAEGFITPNEYFAQKFNEDLAAKYPDIADYINKGEYLKEGTAMGMTLVDQNGNMNAKVINQFLEMKAKAVAPAPTSTPITTIPTVEYTNTEGDITSQEIADKIMLQGESHPRYKEAKEFSTNYMKNLLGIKDTIKQK